MKENEENFKGKRITVMGLGRSGIAVSKLLLSRGADVFGSDSGNPDVNIDGLEFEKGEHSDRVFNADIMVLSPGIPMGHPVVKEAKKRNMEIIGEVEVASKLFKGQLIAVTGTNGKTTTCALINEMLKNGGIKTALGGNISPGIPFSEAVVQSDIDTTMVIEISTFQLETIKSFRPFIGIITNISPDHLDRHKDFKTYVELKRKLFINQLESDYCILNFDQDVTRKTQKRVKSLVYFFSIEHEVNRGCFLSGKDVVYKDGKKRTFLFSESDVLLQGKHNLENVLAASTVSMIADCEINAIRKTVKEFSGVPHRLELIGEIEGVSFVNNSMCTNPVAFKRTIESFKTPFVLICGGRNKNLELQKMVKPIKRAKSAVIIGESAKTLSKYLKKNGYANFIVAETMDEAVELAFKQASRGDTVLLSPGGSSFDMFVDFAARGNCFKESVKRLRNG
jgi:UDP-N-acetylmuramoylalanine--D-glutamate ligase